METLIIYLLYPLVVVVFSGAILGGFKLFLATVRTLSDITNTQIALKSAIENLDERVTHLERTR